MGLEEGTEGSKAQATDQLLEKIGSVGMMGTTPAAALQQQHQTLADVQRQQQSIAAAAEAAQRQQRMQSIAAAAVRRQVSSDPHHHQLVEAQHQQNMAAAAQAHAQHQQDMAVAAQAHRQHQLNMYQAAQQGGAEQAQGIDVTSPFQQGMAPAQPALPVASGSMSAGVQDSASAMFPGAYPGVNPIGMNGNMAGLNNHMAGFTCYGQQVYPGFGGYFNGMGANGMGGFPFVNPYGVMGGAGMSPSQPPDNLT